MVYDLGSFKNLKYFLRISFKKNSMISFLENFLSNFSQKKNLHVTVTQSLNELSKNF